MKRKLVFAMYIYENMFDDLLQRIHLVCLKRYADRFDDFVFWLTVDDSSNYELIKYARDKILSIIPGDKNITFKIGSNTSYREALCFKKEVADNDDECLVFFGHNKGTTNQMAILDGFNCLYYWVIGMYYLSLEFKDDIDRMENDIFCVSLGSFLVKFDREITMHTIDKYMWNYIGTFFWINKPKLTDIMKKEEIEKPVMCDRYYAENYVPNILPCDLNVLRTQAHNMMVGFNFMNFYDGDAIRYMNIVYPNEVETFNKLYFKIIEEAESIL